MSLNDIRNSGLLELYVLGQLEASEIQEVESALRSYPELKTDLREIESALYQYAKIHSVTPSSDVKSKILEEARNSKTSTNSSEQASRPQSGSMFNALAWSLLALSALLTAAYLWKNKEYDTLLQEHSEQIAQCDSLNTAHEERLALLDQIQDPHTRIIPIAATEKYPETDIYFFNNDDSGRNILQLQNLPQLAENESFQLWSLKGDSAPIPLDVFESDQLLLEVDFVEASNAYAITIEPKGGSQTPNLDQLIGVFTI